MELFSLESGIDAIVSCVMLIGSLIQCNLQGLQFWLKFCYSKKGRVVQKNQKGMRKEKAFGEWKLVVVGQDYYVHPNVENPSGPSNKEVV